MFTGEADTVIPLENMLQVKEILEAQNSMLVFKQYPKLGHVGVMASKNGEILYLVEVAICKTGHGITGLFEFLADWS